MGGILGESRHIAVPVLLTVIRPDSFRATFKGRSRTIRAGTKSTVQIEFVPEFEGRFEATLQLIFAKNQQSERFAVYRKLEAVAGSLEDHERFESLNQGRYIPSTGSGQQVPPEKIIPLPSLAGQFGDLPEYELPAKVLEAVNSVTFENPYENQAKHLIDDLVPKEFTMDTYAQYYTALLNIEEGHQQ
jgi:helicase MOV-10